MNHCNNICIEAVRRFLDETFYDQVEARCLKSFVKKLFDIFFRCFELVVFANKLMHMRLRLTNYMVDWHHD